MSLAIDVARYESRDLAIATTIEKRNKWSLGNYRLLAASITRKGEDCNTLEAYITVNGHKATAVFDTGAMGDNLISGKFVSTFQIPTIDFATPISLKMAVKGSRSTINYKSQPVMLVDDETRDITDALVCSLDNYDIVRGSR